jgi:hypothetical protein
MQIFQSTVHQRRAALGYAPGLPAGTHSVSWTMNDTQIEEGFLIFHFLTELCMPSPKSGALCWQVTDVG